MAYEVNGEKYSFDYENLIEELEADLEEHLLETSTLIRIMRSKVSIVDNVDYYPIIDYYYPNMFEDGTFESLHNRDEYTQREWDILKSRYDAAYKQYLEDKPYLEVVSVLAVLEEMKMWNEVL